MYCQNSIQSNISLRKEGRFLIALALLVSGATGCRTAVWHREQADKAAIRNLSAAQTAAFGATEPLTIEHVETELRQRLLHDQALPSLLTSTNTPAAGSNTPPSNVTLTPETALQVAARNSREFQDAKETLYRAALDLDLEQENFRHSFASILSARFNHADDRGEATVQSTQVSGAQEVTRQFQNGTELTGSIAVDLATLLTQDTGSSLGLLIDSSISIPLLRGAGRDIVREPLQQAERNLLYAVYTFERFKRTFAVRIISNYIGVLQDEQQIRNAEQNYKSLITATRRARRLADAGRLPEFQYDQAVQNELRARSRWIQALDSLEQSKDRFAVLLGLPPDATVELDQQILNELNTRMLGVLNTAGTNTMTEVPPADAPVRLAPPLQTPGETLDMTYEDAISRALENRLDMRIALMEIEDAERKIRIAADNLRAELTLFGSIQSGSRRSGANGDDEDARLDNLASSALLTLDLPFNRTVERIAYRKSFISLAARKRDAEAIEDQVKLDIRNAFRTLRIAHENLRIQYEAAQLAERRVASTDMLLQAGRAEIRDVLDAQEALIGAQNALTDAVVTRRIAELEFQRDLDCLDVSADGNMREILLAPDASIQTDDGM